MTYRRRRGLGGAKAQRPDTAPAPERERSPLLPGGLAPWLATIGIVGILFLGGYLSAGLWLPPAGETAEAGPLVGVPELVGLTAEEAQGVLEAVGLEYGIRSTVTHPQAPEGAVLAQSPIPGQQVRPGAPVEVTLSRGPEMHSIPDVAGLSARQATIVLERLGFEVVVRNETHSLEAGRAFGTDPQPGTELSVPADVTLLVSRGAPLSTVPDLTGRHIDDALDLLSESGLALGAISYDPQSFDAPGRIVGQYPPGGYALRRGDPVEIRVAGQPDQVDRSRSRRMERDDDPQTGGL